MKVLIACEESQEVCKAFRARGHEAYSCDIQECSGGHPEWHIQGDALKYINPSVYIQTGKSVIHFYTADGRFHEFYGKWDLLIAHPPCTFLTATGNRWFNVEKYGERAIVRAGERARAAEFFMEFVNARCEKICIENPVGFMSTQYRKPDQHIEPYFFGDPEKKKTALWLKGLPLLNPTNIVEPVIVHCKSGANEPRWHMETMKLPKEERSKARSKTFPGIAKAMAEQWG